MKRKLTPQIFLLLTLIIAASCSAFSQTSDSPTAPADDRIAVGKSQTVAFLIRRNDEARTLIGVQETRINDLEAQLVSERDTLISVTKSYDFARKEIELLKSSNEALSHAVAVNQQTIELLKTDNSKQRENVKKANRAKWKAIAVAAVAVGIKLLIP